MTRSVVGGAKNVVFYDVGASGGAMLALATHFGVRHALGCEAQPLEDHSRATLHSRYASRADHFWIDANLPIENIESFWPSHLHHPYPHPKVLVVYCFDVGFADASRASTYKRVGEAEQACILITCKPQALGGSKYNTPGAVLAALNEPVPSTDWRFALQFPITMRGKGAETKQAWVFYKDVDGRVDFGWVEGAAAGGGVAVA